MIGGGFSFVNLVKIVEMEVDMKNLDYCSCFKILFWILWKRFKYYYIKCINDILKCVNCLYNDN